MKVAVLSTLMLIGIVAWLGGMLWALDKYGPCESRTIETIQTPNGLMNLVVCK